MDAITIIVNDPPYGTERAWNALRYALALITQARVNLFLLGDGVAIAKKAQKTPQGYYNLGQMLERLISKGANVKACVTCIDARGMEANELIDGVEVAGIMDLAKWTAESEKVVGF